MPTQLTAPPELLAATGHPSVIGHPSIDPIVPLPRADAFDDADWTFEPKYDGLRGFIYGSSGGCEIRSAWNDRFDHFSELRTRVARVLGARDVILDGEIVSLDPRGRPIFNELLRGRGYLAFAAFDLLWLDGRDLRGEPFSVRKRELGALLPSATGPLYKIFALAEHGRALFEATKKMELEGIVAKRSSDPYQVETVWYAIRNPAYRQSAGRIPATRPRRMSLRRER
jgi:bifunctional non-homologous end joining protein LigD